MAAVAPLALTTPLTPEQQRHEDAKNGLLEVADLVGESLRSRGSGYDLVQRLLRACTAYHDAKVALEARENGQ